MELKLVCVLLIAIFLKDFFLASLAASVNGTFLNLSARLSHGSNFLLSSESSNFFQAYISCQESNMQLAAITTEAEASDLNFALRNIAKDGDMFWLSGTKLPNPNRNQFYWLTGGQRIVYTDWLRDEPSNEYGEHCMVWEQRKGVGIGWSSCECTTAKRYVCQY